MANSREAERHFGSWRAGFCRLLPAWKGRELNREGGSLLVAPWVGINPPAGVGEGGLALGEQRSDHLGVFDTGEADVEALELVREPFVVDA